MKAMRPIKTFALVALSAAMPALGADLAVAATVEVKALYYKPVHEADAVVLVAAPGEANAVTMVQDGSVVVVRDRVPLVAGPGCEAQADRSVRCTVTPGLSTVFRVRLGDGDDAAQLEGGSAATLDGGRSATRGGASTVRAPKTAFTAEPRTTS